MYIVLAVYKKAVAGKSSMWASLIPVWAILLGAVLGIVAFYATPTLVPADNVLAALLIGMVSGGMATSINQVAKQLNNAANDNKSDADKTTTPKT